MDTIRIPVVIILVISAVVFSGCTSSSSLPVPSPASSTPATGFQKMIFSAEDLPRGLVRAGDGPLQASDVTDTMRTYGLQGGYRALYADTIPMTDKTKVMKQDIMIFGGANASLMLDEHQKYYTSINSNDITGLLLPDLNIGEKSFAVKVTSVDSTGADIYYYVIGFVRSGTYEVISMEGTPETYQTLVNLAKRADEKARY